MKSASVRLTAFQAGKPTNQFSVATGFEVEKETDALDKLKETKQWQDLMRLAETGLESFGIAIWFSEAREKFINEK